jgi:hypothetical protein
MAKEQKQEQAQISDLGGAEAPGPPRSFRLYITLGFVSLILFQMIILWLLLPGKAAPPSTTTQDGTPQKEVKMEEEPIGEKNSFKFKLYIGNDRTASVSLIMHVKVLTKDKYKFEGEYLKKTFTIISAATEILQAATPEDYREHKNTLIREKLKKAINGKLTHPWVQEVIITELSYEVQ